jgi:hypothetical protein
VEVLEAMTMMTLMTTFATHIYERLVPPLCTSTKKVGHAG